MRANDEEWPYDEPHMHKLFADYCIVPGREWFEFDDEDQILMAFLNNWPYDQCEEFSSKKKAALKAADISGHNRFSRSAEKLTGLARCEIKDDLLLSAADTFANEIASVAKEWPDVIE